jgi:single-stranded DNA-binding protein
MEAPKKKDMQNEVRLEGSVIRTVHRTFSSFDFTIIIMATTKYPKEGERETRYIDLVLPKKLKAEAEVKAEKGRRIRVKGNLYTSDRSYADQPFTGKTYVIPYAIQYEPSRISAPDVRDAAPDAPRAPKPQYAKPLSPESTPYKAEPLKMPGMESGPNYRESSKWRKNLEKYQKARIHKPKETGEAPAEETGEPSPKEPPNDKKAHPKGGLL